MDPFQAAVNRIYTQHYGGQPTPAATSWMAQLQRSPEGNKNIASQLFLRQLLQRQLLAQ